MSTTTVVEQSSVSTKKEESMFSRFIGFTLNTVSAVDRGIEKASNKAHYAIGVAAGAVEDVRVLGGVSRKIEGSAISVLEGIQSNRDYKENKKSAK